MKPIEDRVEISIDFPDKFYRGAFEGESRYDAQAEGDGLVMHFERGGLLLWVRTRDAAHEDRAKKILSKHTAHDVHVHGLPDN